MTDNSIERILKEGGFKIEEIEPNKKVTGLKLLTARELQNLKLPEIRWLVSELLPEGLSILAGRPKIGKSWMALAIALSVSRGTRALSYFETTSNGVLYLPFEDNFRRLQSRVNKIITGSAIETAPQNLYYPEDNFSFPKLNENGVDEIEKIIDDNPDIKFIVIDTLGRAIADKGRKDRSIFNADYDLSSKLQKMAISRNISVLLLHHTRKEKTENVFDQIAGSTGLTAGVDTMLVLREKGGEHLLHVTGRDVQENEYKVEFDEMNCIWRVCGKVAEVKMTAEREEIYELIKSYGRKMKTGEISEALGKSKSNISKMLGKMVNDGVLISAAYGVYDLSEDEKGKIKLSEKMNKGHSDFEGSENDAAELFDEEEEDVF